MSLELIVTTSISILFPIFVIVFTYGKLNSRVDHLEEDVKEIKQDLEKFSDKIIVLDEKFSNRLMHLDDKFTAGISALDTKFSSKLDSIDNKFTDLLLILASNKNMSRKTANLIEDRISEYKVQD